MQLDDIPRDNAHESLIFMLKMCIEEQKTKVSFSFHNLPWYLSRLSIWMQSEARNSMNNNAEELITRLVKTRLFICIPLANSHRIMVRSRKSSFYPILSRQEVNCKIKNWQNWMRERQKRLLLPKQAERRQCIRKMHEQKSIGASEQRQNRRHLKALNLNCKLLTCKLINLLRIIKECISSEYIKLKSNQT